MQVLQRFLSCLHLNINLWKIPLLLNISMFFKITNQSVTLIQWRKNDFFKVCGCFRWWGDCDLNFLLTVCTVDTDTLISTVALSQEAAL